MHLKTVTLKNVVETAEYLGLMAPELQLWFIEEVFKDCPDGPDPSKTIDLDTWGRRVDNMAALARVEWQRMADELMANAVANTEEVGDGTVSTDGRDTADTAEEDGEAGARALGAVPEGVERA